MNRSFEEIYEKIKLHDIQKVNNIIKKRNISIIILIILLILLMVLYKIIFYNNIVSIIYLLFFGLNIISIVKTNNKYKSEYKDIVIEKLVESYDSNLTYKSRRGIAEKEYIQANFDSEIKKYYSEDFVTGKILDKFIINMSYVRTSKINVLRDNYGKITSKEEVIIFEGLFGSVELDKCISEQIDIFPNTFISKYKDDRIEIDSAEFEKIYDIFSKDKIYTMQIFTPEIIEEINRFKDNSGYKIQLRIKENKLYFRIHCGKVIKVPVIKEILNRDILYRYFKLIDTPINLIINILEKIVEV